MDPSVHPKRTDSDSLSSQKLSGMMSGLLYFFIKSTLNPKAKAPAL